MNENFESELRRALRPVDAPEGFTERLMRALPARAAPPVAPAPVIELPARAPRRYWLPGALAASLLAAVLAGQHAAQLREERQARAGLEASRELMQALRLTSEKLDIAYRTVRTPPDETAIDQENPS